MCRLFGMHGGTRPVAATFWLLEAPDSLAVQSRREPDGTGLGWYDAAGRPRVERSPVAAYADRRFAEQARHVRSRTFLAHVRFASTGGLQVHNTHPFEQDGRMLAHNGVVGDLPRLDAELLELGTRDLVRGETDSERVLALITAHTRSAGGDLTAGLTSAVRWIAGNLPLYALNLVLISPDELWALRYPDTHDLLVLSRAPGGPAGGRHLDAASAPGSIRVRSGDLADTPAVLVASERLDEDPGWRSLPPGGLLHVGSDLKTRITTVLDEPPAYPISLAELDEQAARSQRPVADRSDPPAADLA